MRMSSLILTILLTSLFGNLMYTSGSQDCNIDRTGLPTDTCSFELRMKGAHPVMTDQYFVSGYQVSGDVLPQNSDAYIVRYEALADAGTAHHILVFGCKDLKKDLSRTWISPICDDGKEQIIFAWAKNAPPLSLPKDVGQHIGFGTDINYIVIQIHYVKPVEAPDNSGIRIYLTQKRQLYVSGIYLLLSYNDKIPADTPKVHIDTACRFDWNQAIVPFGFRTHAHLLGKVISGYKVINGNQFQLIGKGNPQWPQAFYPVEKNVVINPGDILAARCTYNSTGRFRITLMASTSADEMCNFYIMYYMNATMEYSRGGDTCSGNKEPLVFTNIPGDSDVPLPRNMGLEDIAEGHSHHGITVDAHVNTEAERERVGSTAKTTLPETGINAQGDSGNEKYNINDFKDDSVLTYSNGRSKPSLFSSQDYVDDKDGDRSGLSRTQPYFLDYPSYEDYYDIIQQRNRNRMRKPFLETYDANQNYDIPKSSLSSLSRNRIKVFNNEYEDYVTSKSPYKSTLKESDSANRSPTKGDHYKTTLGKPNKTIGVSNNKTQLMEAPTMAAKLSLQFVSSIGDFQLGQVGGLAVSQEGELCIFHRGSNVWGYTSFNDNDRYTLQDHPIQVDTVIILNRNGTIQRHFGRNRFFLPHGLNVDTVGNIWLTDVALHQVFRIPKGAEEPDLTLGVRFEPGSDDKHFCKPADVAVMSTGDFFVADGYCNSRILKFNKSGHLLKQWGTKSMNFTGDGYAPPGTFNLPHGLTLAEDKGLICVADRENGRIQCFDLDGNFVRQMQPKEFGKAVYAVTYSPNYGGVLFAVNGPVIALTSAITQGFVLDINTGQLLAVFNIPQQGLRHPHDVAVNSVDNEVYVGELSPSKVWKFQMSQGLYLSASTNRDMQSHVTKLTQNVAKDFTMKAISVSKKTNTDDEVFGSSVIIVTLLVVTVLLLLIMVVFILLYQKGYCKYSRSKKSIFNMGNFLNTHKGFNRLSTEDDDHDPLAEESEIEDFIITRKA